MRSIDLIQSFYQTIEHAHYFIENTINAKNVTNAIIVMIAIGIKSSLTSTAKSIDFFKPQDHDTI
ncbi:MAG: hypothetical protein AAB972_02800 [Patescibacteria group bacterium]